MPKFHNFRTHKDYRRAGSYDIVPDMPGDFNFTVHKPLIIPEELHMHKLQTDYFTVAKGRVLFRLVHEDGREEQFILSDKDNKTLIISPGIWHGYVALVPSIMVFYINHKFDVSDEYRRKCEPSEWLIPKK